MKKSAFLGSMATILLFSASVFASSVFLTVAAAPHSEAGMSAEIDGVTNLYLNILPSAELHKPSTIVTVYEDDSVIWSGRAIAINGLKIAKYNADYVHNYTLEIQETDGIWVVAQLLAD